MPNVKQGSCENIDLTRIGIKPESAAPDADTFTLGHLSCLLQVTKAEEKFCPERKSRGMVRENLAVDKFKLAKDSNYYGVLLD